MKTRSMIKIVFCSLLVFSLSTLFYQNSQATAAGLNTATQEYATLYESYHAGNGGDKVDKSDSKSNDSCSKSSDKAQQRQGDCSKKDNS